MELKEGKDKFIKTWGELGLNWGINKTMGQIHALLLVATRPVNADQVMEELQISRGNANMNIRALVDWGLIYKIELQGDRKDYYEAEKDIWSAFREIIRMRKTKELHPMIDLLNSVSNIDSEGEEAAEFNKMMNELQLFSTKADKALENLVSSKSNFLVSTFLKVVR